MALFSPNLIRRYEKILSSNPQSKVFCHLGHIYLSQKKISEAKELCLKGIEFNPTYSSGFLLLAIIQRSEGFNLQALETCSHAKIKWPEMAQLYELMGEIYQEQRNLEDALQSYRQALFFKPWSETLKRHVNELEKSVNKKEKDEFNCKVNTSIDLSQLDTERDEQDKVHLNKLQSLLGDLDQL